MILEQESDKKAKLEARPILRLDNGRSFDRNLFLRFTYDQVELDPKSSENSEFMRIFERFKVIWNILKNDLDFILASETQSFNFLWPGTVNLLKKHSKKCSIEILLSFIMRAPF
jgi:hypothetical protein